MVERYSKSLSFDDALKVYKAVNADVWLAGGILLLPRIIVIAKLWAIMMS